MSSIYLEAHGVAGEEIAVICDDLCRLATNTGVSVRSTANGVALFAHPGDRGYNLHAAFLKALKSDAKFKFAHSTAQRVTPLTIPR